MKHPEKDRRGTVSHDDKQIDESQHAPSGSWISDTALIILISGVIFAVVIGRMIS